MGVVAPGEKKAHRDVFHQIKKKNNCQFDGYLCQKDFDIKYNRRL